jgi:hypothetical protein
MNDSDSEMCPKCVRYEWWLSGLGRRMGLCRDVRHAAAAIANDGGCDEVLGKEINRDA